MEIVDPGIERYAIGHTSVPSAAVAALRAETESTVAVPEMAGGRVEAKLLEGLVVASGARRVLEIGTFTGVSAISMAERLPADGELVTLEIDARMAEIARRHIDASPHGDRIRLLLGNALDSLRELDGPFDLVFLDAWKRDYIAYYEAVLPKLSDRGLIVADNVLWGGAVLDPEAGDEEAAAVVAFAEHVQADPRVDNALLTVADGLLVIWRHSGN
ncbi:MAG TPA: O-methyltransferase [Gaiellaceae bacterium]